MKPTILFVTEIRPYPLYGGMYIHIYNVLESLCKHYNVIVLSPPVSDECPLHNQVVAWYPLPTYATDLRNKVQNGFYILRPRPEWQTAIETILQRHRPDGIWFTYGHWGQYAPLAHQHGAFAVMLTQNIQSELTRQYATTLPIGMVYLLTHFRAWAEALHERLLFRNFHCVISLTEIDRRYHAQFIGDERSLLVPGYLDLDCYQPVQSIDREENLLILTGNFQSFQNAQGAAWFVREIWPTVRAVCPTAQLQLVGHSATQLPANILNDSAVEAIDSVPDIVPYLQRATIAVVPILHGSGIRFKVLEALACQVPIVSTTLGAQGIEVVDGESIFLSDDATTFAQVIIQLLEDSDRRAEVARQGFAILSRHYTTSVNNARIQRLVTTIAAQNHGDSCKPSSKITSFSL